MTHKIGSRLRSPVSRVEVILTKVPVQSFEVECAGVPMTADAVFDGVEPSGVAILVGKRYENVDLGVEVLCVAAGRGLLTVNGAPLSVRQAKALPSSD